MKYNKKIIDNIINDGEWLKNEMTVDVHLEYHPDDFEKYFKGFPFKSYDFDDMNFEDKIFKLSEFGFSLVKSINSQLTFIDVENKILITATTPSKLDLELFKFLPNAHNKSVEISFYHHEKNKQRVEEVLHYIFKEIFKKPEKENNFYMIAQSSEGLYNQRATLKNYEIKNNRFDLYYGSSFEHDKISGFFDSEEENLMLLYGLAGAGKTNYIRWLIKHSKRDVIFIPPSMLSVLSQPGFISHMLECKGSALVIEDCEEILSSERNTATANLLNLSDGILGDALDLKILCSFNAPITEVDKALLRKGRLYHSHEFKNLTVKESNDLAKFIGIDYTFTEESSLAEIFNHKKSSSSLLKKSNPIGFGNF